MSLLEIRNVTRRFGRLTAVDRVSLSVDAGEFFTLVGPSGCGKTTLLRMIAGFEEPDEGDLLLDGRPLAGIPPERRPVHTVFQSYALFPHMSVAENVAFPLQMARTPARDIDGRVREALELVHLDDRAQHLPAQLSGGQQQRVALARALIGKPRLLLLDEPLAALDAKLREQITGELIALQRAVGISFVFVTHSQHEALALSHRLAVMNCGHVEQVGSPEEIYARPANRFVAGFIGTINLLPVEVREATPAALRLFAGGLGEIISTPQPGLCSGDRGTLALRPEQVRIIADGGDPMTENRARGSVRDCLYLGDVTVYRIAIAGGVVIEALLANGDAGVNRFLERDAPVTIGWARGSGVFLRD